MLKEQLAAQTAAADGGGATLGLGAADEFGRKWRLTLLRRAALLAGGGAALDAPGPQGMTALQVGRAAVQE